MAGWVERSVATRILPILYPQAREALARYRRDGHTLLIVSATGAHLVGPIAHALGVDQLPSPLTWKPATTFTPAPPAAF